eukprot:10002942-Alexandrium_andersonii.AAC.1
MAASSKSGQSGAKEAGQTEGPPADRSSLPRGRADQDVVPYSSPYYGVAMASKELREGGEAALRLAQGDTAVIQSADHGSWFSSLKVGED